MLIIENLENAGKCEKRTESKLCLPIQLADVRLSAGRCRETSVLHTPVWILQSWACSEHNLEIRFSYSSSYHEHFLLN